MNIFLDAMGGDYAPYEIVKGAIDAVKEYDVKLTLVGHRQAVEEELSKYDYPKDKIEILHAETVIENTEEPAMAIRRKPDSSLVVALDEMKKRDNAVLISAGSTGALLSGGLLKLGRIKGIKRPALAATLPKSDGVFVLIDTGANADCKPEYLEQFAQLGKIYSENVLGKKNPGIGLINIGAEAKKGNSLVKAAYELLEAGDFNFLGNVEARDLPETEADVLVCDGFTGNIVLKLTEGIAAYLLKGMKTSIMSNTKGKIGGMLIKENLRSFKKQFDYAEYGGAPFLGVKGGIIKAHGSSDAFAIKNAIKQSMKFIENDVLQKITDNVKNMEA
ncbi:phosphate acyltransferase PlsX [Acetobacterium wieringae]|uniref:phosphate acyltransferase PlsX n=1 Tax=Acetobacterium wieringae TaxID=52694 RepID=UPI0026E9EAE1|nr:phosphate acyltransferase PlsX [Acetobacterium wieringae]